MHVGLMATTSSARRIMSKTSRIMLGTLALSLTFGAIQLAVGRDLGSSDAAKANDIVNRGAKSDRAPLATNSVSQERTLSFQLRDVSDASVLMRIPAARVKTEAANSAVKSPLIGKTSSDGSNRKTNVACEPMVSVLTEVAKHLQPGRCVT
jgi:hypothetical protein